MTTMVSVREEARLLVSAVAREARRSPPPMAGPCWFLPTPSPPCPSEVDWDLKEVSWLPHKVLTEQLCHFTRFWDSLASLTLSSTTSKACHVTATLATIPCAGGKLLSLTEVLHSLSGQIELFYLATHAGLQSLRYFCCLTLHPGLQPGLQEHLIKAVDKAYETLVVGVWRCSRVNARLQAAYQASPESFHDNVLTPTPTIFSIAHDSGDEEEDEGMEEDVCVDDEPEDSMMDDDDHDDDHDDDDDDPPPTALLRDPLEDAKTHYLRLIVGESKGGGGWGGPQGGAGASVVATTCQPLAPRVLVGREPLKCPTGFLPFQKHKEVPEAKKERAGVQAAVQDDHFAQTCDAEVGSCFGWQSGTGIGRAARGRSGNRAEQAEDERSPAMASVSSAPKEVLHHLPPLSRIQPSKTIRPTAQTPAPPFRLHSLLPETAPVSLYNPRPAAPPSPVGVHAGDEAWSSAFTLIRPRMDVGAKPVATSSPGPQTLAEVSTASQATPLQGLLVDGTHASSPSAFSRVLQPVPQSASLPQPLPLPRPLPLRGASVAAKTNKRPRNTDKKSESQANGSELASTSTGKGGPPPEGGDAGVGEKAPKRARHRLEDHAARMQQHFLSLVDAISSHSLEASESKGANRGSSSKTRFRDGPPLSLGGEVSNSRGSSQKAVRKPRLRASQLRKRD